MSFLIASFPEMKIISKKVASSLKAEYAEISLKKFPDNESLVRINKNPQNKTFVVIASLARDPNSELIETILAAGIGKDHGAKKVILFAAYLPYMRQDKTFNLYESIAAHHVLKILSSHFDELYAIDPHLHRIKSLRQIAKNCHEVSTIELIASYIKTKLKEDYILVGPDSESKQWDKNVAEILNKKSVILEKKRLSSNKVEIKSEKIGSKNILIIDDIISTGHTIMETISILKKQGAKNITVVGIHGLLLNNCGKEISKHASLVTTNTIPTKYSKIDVSPLIVQVLREYEK